AIESGDGLFEQRFLRDETKELFRASTTAQRPKSFTTASGEDERIDRIGHDKWCKTAGDTRSRRSRDSRFLFQNETYKGMRCLSRYPFQKPGNKFRSMVCSCSLERPLALELECSWRIEFAGPFARPRPLRSSRSARLPQFRS